MVTFIERDGQRKQVRGMVGKTLPEVAQRNGIDLQCKLSPCALRPGDSALSVSLFNPLGLPVSRARSSLSRSYFPRQRLGIVGRGPLQQLLRGLEPFYLANSQGLLDHE